MDTKWTSPEMIELTLEEVAESIDLDIACAGQIAETTGGDFT